MRPPALVCVCLFLGSAAAQEPFPPKTETPTEVRLPNGKLQVDELLKSDHEKSLRDAVELIRLSEDVKADLEKNTAFVLSVQTIKKTEEIEKIAKRIRGRIKRN